MAVLVAMAGLLLAAVLLLLRWFAGGAFADGRRRRRSSGARGSSRGSLRHRRRLGAVAHKLLVLADHIGHDGFLNLQSAETLLARQMHLVRGAGCDENDAILARLQHIGDDQLCVYIRRQKIR